MSTISVIIPTYNEEGNIIQLVERLHKSLSEKGITYEIIFVDDHSTDKTQEIITSLIKTFPIQLFVKKGRNGKGQSLLEGFSHAQYEILCMIDADLQYPPEAIPGMLHMISENIDIVVGERANRKRSLHRKIASATFFRIFSKYLHNLDIDVQSGLKIFKKVIIERIELEPSEWSFDIEFLVKARNGGYTIGTYNINFDPRLSGKSKLNLLTASSEIAYSSLKVKYGHDGIIPFHPDTVAKEGHGFHYKGKKFIHHTTLSHHESAFHRVNMYQKITLFSIVSLLIVGMTINWHTTIVVLLAILTFLYFADLLFNFFLIYRSFSMPSEIQVSNEEMAQVNDAYWPLYTIFCPLYHEWQVVPQFITAIDKLEYPKNKLQVMLLLEEDDAETINKIQEFNLPSYVEVMVIPHSIPKTKPKALNYGLQHAKGDYLVIYDAEDIPEPMQLKKAILAFSKVTSKTLCMQAKLNFYNPHQNILTRIFTAEYSLWFDLVLTGLQSISAPIPLGGTSNHFRTRDLHTLKGWDAFNVTEDCDLGMRLVKRGFKTAIIDSITHEEANSDLINWFRQRTRWIKGYIQTYLVHMRDPKAFITNWKEPHVITFQLIVGGKVLSMIINPFMWVITISYFVFRPLIGSFIESFFPTPVLYMGVFSLIIGNFLYMYYYMIGCYKRGQDEIVKYAFLVPFYWLAMSVAAWLAFYQMIKSPHYWPKTEHGLHLNNKKAVAQASSVIGRDLVSEKVSLSVKPVVANPINPFIT